MSATFFALALAAALLDVTLGYPARLEAAIGSPSRWLAAWLRVVEQTTGAQTGRVALVIYLAPPFVAAAAADALFPGDAAGFVIRALLTSTLYHRQTLDRRAREAAQIWERDGPAAAWDAAEALGLPADETRLAPATAAALAARFADAVVAPTLFTLIGGMAGGALAQALATASRHGRRETPLAQAVADVQAWTTTPCARFAALWLALASLRRAAFAAVTAKAHPAEAAMLAALGPTRRDEPGYLREALAIYRRAAALELLGLALAAVAAATLS